VQRVVPVMVGAANVSTLAGVEREVTLLGVTSDMLEVRKLSIAQGHFLPPQAVDRAAAVCVLGPKLARELFGKAHQYDTAQACPITSVLLQDRLCPDPDQGS
jgi:putative ABC transport system permease protein